MGRVSALPNFFMKYKIKIKLNHPNNEMYFFNHLIKMDERVFDLSEREENALNDAMAKHWFKYEKIGVKKRGRPKKNRKHELN